MRYRRTSPLALAVLASAALFGCGEGASSTHSTASPAAAPSTTQPQNAQAPSASTTATTATSPSAKPSTSHAAASRLHGSAAKFVACLRSHGLTGAGAAGAAHSKAMLEAQRACISLLRAAHGASGAGRVAGGASSSASHASSGPSTQALMTSMTACMRRNGVPAYPEPKNGSLDLAAAHIDILSTTYRHAIAYCEAKVTGQGTK